MSTDSPARPTPASADPARQPPTTTPDALAQHIARAWAQRKLRHDATATPQAAATLVRAATTGCDPQPEPLFHNPFTLDDLLIFDDATWRDLLANGAHGLTPAQLAHALRDAPPALVARIAHALPPRDAPAFAAAQHAPAQPDAPTLRAQLLDALFWELTYWQTPDLYESLTEGEQIHPGIFAQLAPILQGATALDIGAGSGRATFAMLRVGARHIYAVEPSPGLLRLLRAKLTTAPNASAAALAAHRVTTIQGRFAHIPLPNDSVDLSLSCSAFTAAPEQGGEPGLAELQRVTRAGGLIVIIWPRPQDYPWLAAHGFSYVALPAPAQMGVRFRSLGVALRVATRFYARNHAALRHLLLRHRPTIPFATLGVNPPHDYCWLRVTRTRP